MSNGMAVDWSALVVYLCVMGMMSVGLGLVAGCVSFVGSFVFVQVIYNSLKLE
jgi:hypothetical protein